MHDFILIESEFENVVQNVNLLDDEIVVDNGVTLLVLEVNYKKYTYIENFPFRKSNLKKHDNGNTRYVTLTCNCEGKRNNTISRPLKPQ